MGSRLKTWKHFRKLQSRRQKVALENRFLEVAKKKRKGTQGQVPVLKDRLKRKKQEKESKENFQTLLNRIHLPSLANQYALQALHRIFSTQ